MNLTAGGYQNLNFQWLMDSDNPIIMSLASSKAWPSSLFIKQLYVSEECRASVDLFPPPSPHTSYPWTISLGLLCAVRNDVTAITHKSVWAVGIL